jgi:hypothetical protein
VSVKGVSLRNRVTESAESDAKGKALFSSTPIDREDNLAESAPVDEVAQGIRPLSRRKAFRYDRFDPAGLKQRDDGIPGFQLFAVLLNSRAW